ncbi:MAG: histidinol dehydrogenase [Candidatus Methylomirabilis sp.]|nr:histidinol dehydrogenase [Candidatus Methylomirabilis sp.]
MKGLDEAAAIANEIAPEHLELLVRDPWRLLPQIRCAGAIFMGDATPETVGDYLAGPNHILPTGGQRALPHPSPWPTSNVRAR